MSIFLILIFMRNLYIKTTTHALIAVALAVRHHFKY